MTTDSGGSPRSPLFGRRSRPRRGSLRERATDLAYATGWRIVREMPDPAARRLFAAGARYAARDGGPVQLRKNLARVLGVPPAQVPDTVMQASLASYARYWRETFRLPSMDLHALGRELAASVDGADHVDAALVAGHGVILALPHSGNWDMAGVWLAQTHGRFMTVAERLKPESLYRRFIDYRENLGFDMLPLVGGPRPAFDVLAERLAGNGVVCLMAERDLTHKGVQVDFFGEPTRMPAGPAKLALETGAPLLAAHCWFEGNGWRTSIGAPLDCSSGDVGVITQTLADTFSRNIAAHPEDWHMLQPQWLADLSESRQARLKDA